MFKLKRIFAVVSVLLITAISVYPVFAQENIDSHSISVINTVGLDNVHIAINQYDIVDGQKTECHPNPIVLPGQTIQRTCEISNLAYESWIRVKTVFAEDAPKVGKDFLTISSEKWKECGEYYYYTEPVPNDSVIEFFNRINIPAEWDNSYAGKTINFTVYADAVQTKNFSPNFESEEPWFGTVIEHRVHDDYIIPTEKGDQNFQVIYKDGAEGLVKIGDDFFSNWSVLMPGDVETDSVIIKNEYAYPTTIYFKINDIDDSKLVDKLHLRIYTAKGDIYNGSLLGKVTDEIELVTLKNGEELEMFYELTVPPELTNEFSLTKAKTEWVFRVFSENMQPPTPDATSSRQDSSTPDSPDTPSGGSSSYNNGGASTVQTGDVSIAISLVIAVIIGIAALYLAISQGGSRREEK